MAQINIPTKFKIKQIEVTIYAILLQKIDINSQCSAAQTKWVTFSTKGMEIRKDEVGTLFELAGINLLQLEMDKHSLTCLVYASDEEALREDFLYKGKKV